MDVVVTSFDKELLQSQGIEILQELWSQNIAAELADLSTSLEAISGFYRDQGVGWLVIIKQEHGHIHWIIKVRNLEKKDEKDLNRLEVLPHIKSELAEKRNHGNTASTHLIHSNSFSEGEEQTGLDVQIITNENPRKRVNRRYIADKGRREDMQTTNNEAIENVSTFVQNLEQLPVYAIETRDDTFDLLRISALGNETSWRHILSNSPAAQKTYLQHLHNILKKEAKKGIRRCFLYNYRTESVLLYDMY